MRRRRRRAHRKSRCRGDEESKLQKGKEVLAFGFCRMFDRCQQATRTSFAFSQTTEKIIFAMMAKRRTECGDNIERIYTKNCNRDVMQSRSAITKTSANERVQFWCGDLDLHSPLSPYFASALVQNTNRRRAGKRKKQNKMTENEEKTLVKKNIFRAKKKVVVKI